MTSLPIKKRKISPVEQKSLKRKRLTQNDFIRECKDKFPDYDFSRVSYTKEKARVEIGCPIHGFFEVIAKRILGGHGCPACVKNKRFIGKCEIVHQNKYDYSITNYSSPDKYIFVKCPSHGRFTLTARAHLYNMKGCPVCESGIIAKTSLDYICSAEDVEIEIERATEHVLEMEQHEHICFTHDYIGNLSCVFCFLETTLAVYQGPADIKARLEQLLK